MAVHERTYKRYAGALSPDWSRSSVLPRYALQEVFRRRFFLVYFVLCFLAPIVAAGTIYTLHNFELLRLFDIDVANVMAIDADFFLFFLRVQGTFAFFMVLFVAPSQISKDLANNALPLYLSRPFSRTQYVVGKLTLLAALVSAVTWIPGLFLYIIQGSLEKGGWMLSNLRIAFGMFVGSWVWILVFCLLALALSAWMRWKLAAAFSMVVLYFGGELFAIMTNLLLELETEWGHLLNPRRLTVSLWSGMLGAEPSNSLSPLASGVGLLAYILISLWLLRRKLKAYEVVS